MQGAAPTSQDPRFIKHTGQFYRIVFAAYADKVLDGVIHSEGRFHKNGQTALYASPSHETASVAIDIYVKPGDADRVIVPLLLENARLADLRDRALCAALGIDPSWPSVPWADQRAAGQMATSWLASDAVRQAGADGMIYSSRRAPSRWHVVLFSWNKATGAQLRQNGPATTWVQPGATSV
ncbi:RES family NAD+ phosphorylase [Yoonia sp. BS5-3]|uniref:RES family NAD+ phosphorylase n=1 Tax=Yoonia phaeophyticola TaxID=3137369 RepID=A0ABZ2V8U2_9RHOB